MHSATPKSLSETFLLLPLFVPKDKLKLLQQFPQLLVINPLVLHAQFFSPNSQTSLIQPPKIRVPSSLILFNFYAESGRIVGSTVGVANFSLLHFHCIHTDSYGQLIPRHLDKTG